MKNTKLMLAALLVISPLTANAEIVTWEATGRLTVVDTSGGSITEFPTAAVGTPFTLTFTFDSSAGLSSTTIGANGTRYRYIDAPLSVELSVGGTGLGRAQQGFASIDIWDDFTFAGSSDPASDGFSLIWGVESSQVGGFAQNGLVLRGPETLDIFTGPGLPTTPSPQLTALSLTVVQLIDETDLLVGNVESVSRVADPEVLLEQLSTAVTGVGPGNSFADKIMLAQTYLAVPDVQSACAMLDAFLKQVRAQRGKKLTTEQADQFTADVDAIQAAVGCD